MDNLLEFALEAHGGLGAWDKLQSLHANVSIGGALWDLKQLPGLLKNTRVDLKLSYQHVVTHLINLEELIVFTSNQVSLESESGKTLDTCNGPRSRFSGTSANSKWDKLHAGYFSSYALWDTSQRRSSTPEGANYASEYRAVHGVMLPTRRRVFAYDDARQKVPEPILVSIDLSEIHFT